MLQILLNADWWEKKLRIAILTAATFAAMC
jgi:hypothetical protein